MSTGTDWRRYLTALAFLAPALIVLGALVAYPIFFTVLRSLFDEAGDTFVGAGNYRRMFTDPQTLVAVKNNAIWVAAAPALATAMGLIFAVVTERVKAATLFKTVIFMPMAISFLSVGIIFRLVYQDDPDIGLANAVIQGVAGVFTPPGDYPGARPSDDKLTAVGDVLRTPASVPLGNTTALGIIGLRPSLLPDDRLDAATPPVVGDNDLGGTVWLDFSPDGDRGVIDPGEPGLPGVKVEAVRGSEVVAGAKTSLDGSFVISDLPSGDYALQLADSNFRPAFGGFSWLGPALVTPAVIVSFIWMWAGFAMVIISAGLASIPRETLESARVDGANEWQVFRRIIVPLLAPILLVVFVTLLINVMKIFDLVLIVPPGSSQDDATVLALRMWRVSFGGGRQQGLGSAISVFLFALVVPAMVFNIRRFRREG